MKDPDYIKGFLPYALAAILVGLVGGFSAVLGPAFVKDMGIPYNNTAWTALATAISSAAFAPVMGKLADVLGRGRMLLLGVGTYTLGNILTATAGSLLFMLAARFVVGVGMAAIAPVIMAYILTEFPADRIAKGFAVYMLISSASVVVGPTAGQWIIRSFGWRAMIWLCVALCAAVLCFCAVSQEKSSVNPDALTAFDWSGAVLVLVFFGLALCIPSFGQNYGWDSAFFRIVFLAAALSLLGLILAEQRAKNPILPLPFMKRKTFLLSVLALFLTQGLMQANMTNSVVYVEYTQPENTVVSGYAISVMYIGMALGAVFIGRLADQKEPKNVLTASLLVTMAGCALMLLFSRKVSVLLMMLSLGLLGFGSCFWQRR